MIYAIYFSPTDNSKKYVEAMCKAISNEYISLDITSKEVYKDFTNEDFVIIGAPVYAGRIPHVSKQRFSLFKGNKTPCIIVGTYGNRHYDDALVEMQDLFESNGFVVYGACALIGRHTYGSIAIDRPNENDLKEACKFSFEIYHRNKAIQNIIPGNHHDNDVVNKGRFHPLTTKSCIQCGLCVSNCPVGAILEDCKTISNDCISCFRCIRKCPVMAKNMDDENYNSFAAMFTEKLKEPRENEYFK